MPHRCHWPPSASTGRRHSEQPGSTAAQRDVSLPQCLQLNEGEKCLEKLIFYISSLTKLAVKKRQLWGVAFILSRVQCFGSKAWDGARGRKGKQKFRHKVGKTSFFETGAIVISGF